MAYLEVDIIAGTSIEEVIDILNSYEPDGTLVYAYFNGTPLYGHIDTVDTAYIKHFGVSKDQWEANVEDKRKKRYEKLAQLS